LQEHFTILHDAVENIRADKQFGDSMVMKIELLTDDNEKLATSVREMQVQTSKLIQERD